MFYLFVEILHLNCFDLCFAISVQGDKIFSDLMKAGTERGIRIRIAQSEPTGSTPDFDTKELEVKGIT